MSLNMRIEGSKVILHCRVCKTEIILPLSEYKSVTTCPDPWTCRTCAEHGRGIRYNGINPYYIRQATFFDNPHISDAMEAMPV